MAITTIINQADQLVNAVRGIDLEAVVAHQPEAVQHLEAVLVMLNAARSDEAKEGLQSECGGEPQQESRADQLVRHSQILGSLKKEGFDGRLGKVYNSTSDDRMMEFRLVPHREELPAFDMVVAADYTPSAGLHGIFISAKQVYSVFLAAPTDQNKWQVLKSRSYQTMDEMIEIVTLLSAGFDLP